MGFLRRIFERGSGVAAPSGGGTDDSEWRVATEASFEAYPDRQRVTVWLRLHDAAFENEREQGRIFALEDRLMRALDASGVGEHDTNSLEDGYFGVRLVGVDADAIVAAIAPILSEAPPGSYLALRRGPVGSGEERAEVGRERPDGG